jgi:valine dehydrogenase (NAD+)
LAHPGIDVQLKERGIRYAPDYVVNAGGLIQVAGEVEGYDDAQARARTHAIFDTTLHVFEQAGTLGIATGQAADLVAERRMAAAGALARNAGVDEG